MVTGPLDDHTHYIVFDLLVLILGLWRKLYDCITSQPANVGRGSGMGPFDIPTGFIPH